jgi:phospholipase/carboxylesterase
MAGAKKENRRDPSLSSARPGSSKLGFVHRFIPSEGSKVTLLALHGTGGNEEDLVPLARRLLPGAAVLSPRGKVLENGMPRFFRRLAEGVFDTNDLVARTDELVEFISKASETYGFDGDKVIAIGYSNGANIAASTLLLHPRALAGAVLLRPMVPFRLQGVPDLSHTKVLIESGTNDSLIPKELPEELAGILKGAGAKVSLRWQEGGGHTLTDRDIEAAGKWLAESF